MKAGSLFLPCGSADLRPDFRSQRGSGHRCVGQQAFLFLLYSCIADV